MKDLELKLKSKTFQDNLQIINTVGLIASLSTVLSEIKDPDLKETLNSEIANNIEISKIFADLKFK